MIENLFLITSVINTPNIPLSYCNIRSVYNNIERFEQTKKTIDSIKKYTSNTKLFLIECSNLTDEQKTYFFNNVDLFYNIYDTNDNELINKMFTTSKSLGEGTMTIEAIKYLKNNNINFNNLFKISGRYWLNNSFDYNIYNNNKNVIKYVNNNLLNCFTCFYKLTNKYVDLWYNFLINSTDKFNQNIQYEKLFSIFINSLNEKDDMIILTYIGINGNVSAGGDFIDH